MAKQYTLKEKRLAIVLLDIIGSTAFVQKVGALKAAEWFQYHDTLTRRLCLKYNGREIDRSDGFLMSFDRPVDAVNFALIYQSSIPIKTRLNTRIGIHWGKVIEVQQDELWQAVGAKSVELEGIAKNIAARTMSLCGAGQVLLTSEAMKAIKGRVNRFTPKGTRYVCVGSYRFKGVASPQTIYAVGQTIESLQPPKGSDKVKRLGGPRYVRSRARDRKIMEWVWWLTYRLGFLALIFWLYVLHGLWSTRFGRDLLGMPYMWWVEDLNAFVLRLFTFIVEGVFL